MCVSCGGGEIRNNHGDSRHLTREVIQQAADVAGLAEHPNHHAPSRISPCLRPSGAERPGEHIR